MGLYDDLEPTEKETELIEAAAKGEFCDLSTGDDAADDSKNGADWGAERTIRSKVIIALATGARDDWEVAAKGIQLIGAKIEGELDFEEETVTCPLVFERCYFGKMITLLNARTRSIYIQNSRTQASQGPAIRGDGLCCDGDLNLRETSVKGEIRLLGARIGGDLTMNGATLENPDGDAFSGDGLTTTGGVFMGEGFSAKGTIRLSGADIGGDLLMRGAALENPNGAAFSGDRLTTKDTVFMGKGFSAKGTVRLLGAHIGGNLDMNGATLENPDGDAFSGDGLTTKGDVFMRDGFSAKGKIRLLGAHIGGDLSMTGAALENPDGDAFSGDRLTTRADSIYSGSYPAATK